MTTNFRQLAVAAIFAERRRQIDEEHWSLEHDNDHENCELGNAGNCYLRHAIGRERVDAGTPGRWPWDAQWWKPVSVERDLVRAGALFVAERERLERLPESTKRSERLFTIKVLEADAAFYLSLIYRDRHDIGALAGAA